MDRDLDRHLSQRQQFLVLKGAIRVEQKNQNDFPHSVFYPFGELPAIFIKFEIVVCKLFQFGRV